MDAGERSRDIYEQIAAFPKPPLVPLPGPGEIDAMLAEAGLRPGAAGHRVSKAAMALTGFNHFLRRLPRDQERLMRRCDQRGAWLFAPLVSATTALQDDPRTLGPLERAATLLHAAQSFHADLHAGRLVPDTLRGEALEMGQYPNLFATSLILEDGHARIFKSVRSDQAAVVVRNRLYLLDIGQPGAPATVPQLIERLEEIVCAAHASGPADDITAPGLLTCADHMTQCRIFAELDKSADNRTSLEALRHSFLTLCLDLDSAPASYAEAAHEAHAGRPANRWWHASLQLVIFGNAKACAICNFNAYLDGNVMMRASAELQQRAAACSIEPTGSLDRPPLAPPLELRWVIKPEHVELARRDLEPVLDRQQATFEIQGVGADFFAAHRVDAISVFTLALQMTAKRLITGPAEITQFLTMSRYRCMDLTTAVMTTPQVHRFVDYLDGQPFEREEALALMQDAIAAQQQRCRTDRSYLPLEDIIGLLMCARPRLTRIYTSMIFFLRARLLRSLDVIKRINRDIIVSHPTIYPEVPVIGRPGVRLTYVRYFALHYQIWADKIVVTFMPAIDWQIPNAQLISELEADLRRLQAIIA